MSLHTHVDPGRAKSKRRHESATVRDAAGGDVWHFQLLRRPCELDVLSMRSI